MAAPTPSLAWLLAMLLPALALGCQDEVPPPNPDLEWEPCDHGRDQVDGRCVGPAELSGWVTATDGCAAMVSEEAGSRWRLPSPDELAAFIRADPTIDPARRWSNAHGEEHKPVAIDHAGYPQDQEHNKRLRYRCVKD